MSKTSDRIIEKNNQKEEFKKNNNKEINEFIDFMIDQKDIFPFQSLSYKTIDEIIERFQSLFL